MTTYNELLPCPFCGNTNIHIAPDDTGSGGQWVGPVHVVCGGDCVAGQSGDDRESAIAAWNRRAALQSQDREDAERYRWLRDPCSGAEYAIFYSRGDYGTGLMSGTMLDAAIDHARRVEGNDHV